MQIKDILIEAALKLRENGIETPRLDAEVLLSSVIKKERFYFYTHPEEKISHKNYVEFQALLKRRLNHEPIAYITGKKEFMGLDFIVRPGVLIPRPDTEILTEYAIELIGNNKNIKKVLDLCAGSGAIGLAIKENCPEIELVSSDISETALGIIRENSKSLGLETTVIESDLFENLKGQYDLIVSNPPYIKSSDIKTLSPEIREFEPEIALNGGLEGYDFYVDIASQAVNYLSPGGCLALEIGDCQAEEVTRILKDNAFKNISLIRDLGGRDRVLVAFRI